MPKEAKFDARAFIDKCRGSYKELVSEAKKAGVRPCLELHMGNFYPSASGAMALLQGIPPEDVGVLYDPANMISDGWEVPKVALNVLGPYLAEVHVKNSRWIPGATENGVTIWKTEPADLENGCVNWIEVIAQLKAQGYNGWLIEEGHTAGRESYQRLKLAYELLKKLV
jgi:sugar phosphate isomerase/epimerase